jgi:hypothetical protein
MRCLGSFLIAAVSFCVTGCGRTNLDTLILGEGGAIFLGGVTGAGGSPTTGGVTSAGGSSMGTLSGFPFQMFGTGNGAPGFAKR